jgi:thymidylate kinase
MRVVLEGLSGAGKTTLSRRLSQQLKAPLLPGAMRSFMREWATMPLKKPYYKLNDELKEFIAGQLVEPVIIFDRCYTSTLAYAFALSKCKGAKRSDGQCYEDQLEWYFECMANKTLTTPDIVIILDIPPDLSIQRKPNAHDVDKNFADINFLEAIREYYKLFYEVVEPQVNSYWVEVQRPVEEIYSHVESLIQQELKAGNVEVKVSN